MTVHSILYDEDGPATAIASSMPPFFADLNLDQLVAAATAGREEYNLEEYFFSPLHTVRQIDYRHKVVRDLASPGLRDAIRSFGQAMRDMRAELQQSNTAHYVNQGLAWHLAAADRYADAVRGLASELALADTASRGFQGLRRELSDYLESGEFVQFAADIVSLKQKLSEIHYCVRIHGARVTVTKFNGRADYTREVEAAFERFHQGAAKDYRVNIPDYLEMNHVEAQVLDGVAKLYPDAFADLRRFSSDHGHFVDSTVETFDREVQFYLGYLDVVDRIQGTGVLFCEPEVSEDSKDLDARGTFDIVLADKLAGQDLTVVTNDAMLASPERIFVVTGPNQGGKTTFARTVGQLHYLARLGLPVPGTAVRLFLVDTIFTHFTREEDSRNLHGKLEEDLLRIHDILAQATPTSLVITNELFSSTTLADAITLGTAVLDRLIRLECLGVYVTFVDELSRLGPAIVSLVAAIDETMSRTFKVERRAADGLSYALTIARKYGLTYDELTEQISR